MSVSTKLNIAALVALIAAGCIACYEPASIITKIKALFINHGLRSTSTLILLFWIYAECIFLMWIAAGEIFDPPE